QNSQTGGSAVMNNRHKNIFAQFIAGNDSVIMDASSVRLCSTLNHTVNLRTHIVKNDINLTGGEGILFGVGLIGEVSQGCAYADDANQSQAQDGNEKVSFFHGMYSFAQSNEIGFIPDPLQ